MSPKIIYATIILIFAIIGMTMLLDLNPFRIAKRKQRLYFTSIALIMFANIFLMIKIGQPFMALYPLLVHLPLVLLFCFISRRGFAKVFFVLLTMIFLSYPPALVDIMAVQFFNISALEQLVLLTLSCISILLFICKFMWADFSYVMKHLSTMETIRFCFVPVGYNILNYLLGRYNYDATISPVRIVLFLSALGVYSLLLSFFHRTREFERIQVEQSQLTLQIEATKEQLQSLRISQEQMAIYRHDLRHHLTYLNSCILENKLQDATEFIKQTCEDMDSIIVEQYSQNEPVNLILSSYVSKAKEKGISIEVNVSVTDFERFQITDLCSLLANALENAINACMQMNSPNEHFIRLRMYEKNNKLCLHISNSYSVEPTFEQGIPISQKEGHGIGVKSIIHVIEKYEGIYGFSIKNGAFTFQVSM